ncbi:MAG: tetratricopeptide repeat protein [Anaerolineaceae bacterium]|nr:tetratricopeptide repeat protein [Anaerolineaceae bacterium]
MQIEKTVFISYRRTNAMTARAVYQNLTSHNYDCFLDFESIDSGSFESIILNQIAARAHFIVVLTPSALERCADPNDWLRQEIEYALEMKRNIVPLMFDRFSFSDVQKYLIGKLAVLPGYNALEIPPAYFDEAMDRLRSRFLNKALDVILHPTPKSDESAVQRAKTNEDAQPAVPPEKLTAEELFERATKRDDDDLDGRIADYTEAIRLNPNYAEAYSRRGGNHASKGEYEGAMRDYNEALRINPREPIAYNNRGSARKAQGDLDGAMADYNEAIRLNPKLAAAYNNRGVAHQAQGDLDGAMADYNEAIRLNPQYAEAYNNRGNARSDNGDLDGAIADYSEAIRINPQDVTAYYNRGSIRHDKDDLNGTIADYNEAIHLNPQYAPAYLNRGFAHHGIGDLNGAIADYNEAIRLNPQYADAYNNRGEVFFAQQQFQKAHSDFSKANELKPGDNFVLAGLAITHHAVGNKSEAKRLWRLLITIDSRYQDIEWVKQELNWGDALVEEGRKLIAAL